VSDYAVASILAYVASDDTQLLKTAKRLAVEMHARLKIVDAVEPLARYFQILLPKSGELARLVRSTKKSRLQRIVKRLRVSGLPVKSELLDGPPENAVIVEILKNRHDLLIVGSINDDDGGTTSMRLLRKCPCPVWVVAPTRLARRMRILAAVDALPRDEARAELNGKILATASFVARVCGGELHVLNAWRAVGDSLRRPSRFARYRDEIAAHVRETRLHHSEQLDAALKQAYVSLPERQVHLVKGNAGEVIPKFCNAHKVDLLVLGTVARTGLSASLIGNTAETLARTIGCSMLAVKPDGFVSPIRFRPAQKHSEASLAVD
jgi:universal stress protein E